MRLAAETATEKSPSCNCHGLCMETNCNIFFLCLRSPKSLENHSVSRLSTFSRIYIFFLLSSFFCLFPASAFISLKVLPHVAVRKSFAFSNGMCTNSFGVLLFSVCFVATAQLQWLSSAIFSETAPEISSV